jgi:hypothetical protein
MDFFNRVRNELFNSQDHHCLTVDQTTGDATFIYKMLKAYQFSYRAEQGLTQQLLDNLIVLQNKLKANKIAPHQKQSRQRINQ